MTLDNESTYLPFSTAKLAQSPWLVLAPHPDDETFGMGGTILLAQSSNIEIDVLFVTDGSAAVSSDSDLATTREREARVVCEKLGIRYTLFWREKDRELSPSQHLIKRLSELIRTNQYATVFFPSPQEPHPDHRTTAVIAWESLRQCQFSATPISYDISTQAYTNQLIDITQVVTKKEQIMACYASQMTSNHYVARILGLNQARAWSLPLTVSHAEAFYLWPKEDRPLNALLLSIASRQSSLQALPESLPLVSVIIRTQNRPEFLREAIRSVAGQTYPNIELIVINDGGTNCSALVSEEAIANIQQYNYHQLDQQMGRSRAANVGLDLCNGEYIIFLDDDDWFESDHLSILSTALIEHPQVKAAYSGVKCVDENKNILPTQFSTPYNAIRLISGNYIPINSVLFSRALIDLNCRFDESFEFYEDWDFWIQASMLTEFLFVEGLSAVYRICKQSGFGVNADHDTADKASLAIYHKWLPLLQQEQLLALMALVRLNFTKDQQLHDKDQQLQDKNHELVILSENLQMHDEKISSLTEEVHELRTSSSWKITKPYRFLGYKIKQIKHDTLMLSGTLKSSEGFKSILYKASSVLRNKGSQGNEQPLLENTPNTINHQSQNSYAEWILQYDSLTDESRKHIQNRIEMMSNHPKISIIMSTYNPTIEFLDEAIGSVIGQLYTHWELCIADDASTDPAVCNLLKQYAAKDERIKLDFRQEKGGLSTASNYALKLASGEFIALMDNNDKLAEHALFWVAETLNNHPDACLIYSDEDKLSAQDGSRIDPYFKCDWNPELFLGHNLIAHLGVYKTDIVKQINGFKVGFEGAQDYDLAARFIEKIKPQQIHHIPGILYHSRILPGSTTKSIDGKAYADIASEKAINEHLARCNIKAQVKSCDVGHRVQFDLPDIPPLVSIIIPTRNGLDYVRTCITSIFSLTTYQNFEIILVDNGSDEAASLSYFSQLEQEHKNFSVIRDDKPFNYSALNNLAVKSAKGEVIALLNNDIEILSPDWLSEMVSIALQPGVGAVGAKLLYPDDTLQHAGIILGLGGWAGHAHKHFSASSLGYVGRAALTQCFSAVTGACMVIKRSKFLEVGGLNEIDLAIACNDVELCLKLIDAGYRNVWTPFATLYHHESATRGYEDTPEKKNRFTNELSYMHKHWGEILQNDPAYNPNLTLDHEDFSLAWPPRTESLKVLQAT